MTPLGEILLRLVVAAVLTAIIGVDRELRAKPAGLRTNIVVGTATAAFAYLGAEVITGVDTDPARVAAQVVSGIGFLGGGAIFAAGGRPSGLTTAAALWGSAAVGLAAGIGAFSVAAALVAVLFAVLWPLDRVADRALRSVGRHDVHAQLVLTSLEAVADVQRIVTRPHLRIVSLRLREVGDRPIVDLELSGGAKPLTAVMEELQDLVEVVALAHRSISRMET